MACFGWTRQVAHVSGTCTMSATRPTRIYQLKSLTEPQPASNWPDARKERPAEEQLGDRVVHLLAEKAQQAVVRRLPDVRAIHKAGQAPAEQALQPPLVLQWCTVLVNDHELAVGRVALRMPLQGGHHLLQAIRRHAVVAGRDVDVLPTRAADALIPVRIETLARRLRDQRRAGPAARAPGRTPRPHPRSSCR